MTLISSRAPALTLLLGLALLLPAAAAAADAGALGWLAGCWDGEGGGGRNQECWTTPEGGILLGVSRVIGERGTSFEFLRIGPHEDGLALFASPGGKPAVAFPLVESGEGLAVFANPGHDFPQRITYRREADRMTARVEAERDGSWDGFGIAWELAPAAWPRQAPADPADLAEQVRETEAAFARTMAERDPAAFAAFLDDEAIFLSAATARGAGQVAAQWSGFFATPQAPFSWQPETVEVLASGGLALSTGPVYDPAGKLIARFSSIWRRGPAGEWRIVFDKGEPVCAD